MPSNCLFKKLLSCFILLLVILTNVKSGTCIEKQIQAYVFNDHSFYSLDLPSGTMKELLKVKNNEFISSLKFSPNQEKLIMITGKKKYDATKLYLVDPVTWQQDLVLEVKEDSLITIPFWAPNSKNYVILVGYQEKASGDFLHYQHYWFKLGSAETKDISDIKKLMEPINSVSWSSDSRYVAFNGKESQSFSLFILDISTKEINETSRDLPSDWIFKNLNHFNLGNYELYQIKGSEIYLIEADKKRTQKIIDMQKEVIIQRWCETKPKLLIVTKQNEENSLFWIDFKTKEPQEIQKAYHLDSPRWSPDGNKVSFFSTGKDDLYAELNIIDLKTNQAILQFEVGSIEVYPWDIDPTYSEWGNRSDDLLVITKKEGQSQFLSRANLRDKTVNAISINWDYIYNTGWSPMDDWIYVTGQRSEKDMIELIRVNESKTIISKPDLKFCAWENDPASNSSEKNESKTIFPVSMIMILSFSILLMGLIAFVVYFLIKINRKKV